MVSERALQEIEKVRIARVWGWKYPFEKELQFFCFRVMTRHFIEARTISLINFRMDLQSQSPRSSSKTTLSWRDSGRQYVRDFPPDEAIIGLLRFKSLPLVSQRCR